MKRRYSPQFKAQVIALWENGDQSMTEIEKSLGLPFGTIRSWKRQRNQSSQNLEAEIHHSMSGSNQKVECEPRELEENDSENAFLWYQIEVLRETLREFLAEIRPDQSN